MRSPVPPGPAEWRRFDDDHLGPILRAALGCFAEHGYHGTSIRMLAEAAGLSVPGVYHHYRSKQEILRRIVDTVMAELVAHVAAAEEASDGTPGGRFDAVVEALVLFHMSRRSDAFVASTEMRSMDPELRAAHIASRDALQSRVEQAIADGVRAGHFSCDSPADAARAVCSLCVSIATWYRPSGALSPDALVAQYLGYCRRIAGRV